MARAFELCSFFQTGDCIRADDCGFLHGPSDPRPVCSGCEQMRVRIRTDKHGVMLQKSRCSACFREDQGNCVDCSAPIDLAWGRRCKPCYTKTKAIAAPVKDKKKTVPDCRNCGKRMRPLGRVTAQDVFVPSGEYWCKDCCKPKKRPLPCPICNKNQTLREACPACFQGAQEYIRRKCQVCHTAFAPSGLKICTFCY